MISRTRICVQEYLFAHEIIARIRILFAECWRHKIKIEKVVDEIYGCCAANDKANDATATEEW